MTYNTRKKILYIGVHEKVKLNKSEHRLLICLSNEEATSYRDMEKYIDVEYTSLNSVRKRLTRKTKNELHIKVIRGYGFILENEIYFE